MTASPANQLLRTLAPPWLALLAMPVALTSLGCSLLEACSSRDVATLIYSAASWLAFGLLAFELRRCGVSWQALGWRAPTLADLGWALAACAAGILLVYPLAQWINGLVGATFAEKLLNPSASPGGLALQVFYACITAPIVEEMLFRGFAIGYLRSRGLPVAACVTLPLAAFALIHWPGFGTGGVIFITLWGTLPTALYLWRGNLPACIAMHALNNLFAYIVFPLLQ